MSRADDLVLEIERLCDVGATACGPGGRAIETLCSHILRTGEAPQHYPILRQTVFLSHREAWMALVPLICLWNLVVTGDLVAEPPPSHNRSPRQKLTHDQVVEIRAKRAAGAKLSALSREYGISLTAVGALVRGETYRWVP